MVLPLFTPVFFGSSSQELFANMNAVFTDAVAGDLLILTQGAQGSAGIPGLPSGFTLRLQLTNPSGGGNTSWIRVASKIAVAGDTSLVAANMLGLVIMRKIPTKLLTQQFVQSGIHVISGLKRPVGVAFMSIRQNANTPAPTTVNSTVADATVTYDVSTEFSGRVDVWTGDLGPGELNLSLAANGSAMWHIVSIA